MAKIIIHYIKDGKDLLLDSVLKVKIDEDIKFEVKKGFSGECELKSGVHILKYYFTGYGKNDIYGYDEKEINILDKDNFFVYKTPVFLMGKGKFIACESESEFNKKIKFFKILKIIGPIIAFIVVFIICYLYF